MSGGRTPRDGARGPGGDVRDPANDARGPGDDVRDPVDDARGPGDGANAAAGDPGGPHGTEGGGTSPGPRRRLLPNTIIVGFLVLQFATCFKLVCPPKVFEALAPLRVACPPTLYPFLDYNMYNAARHAGEVFHDYRLLAEHGDGRTTALSVDEVGTTRWRLRGVAIDPLLDGDLRDAEITLHHWLRDHPDTVALRLMRTPHRLEDDGTLTELPREEALRVRVRDGRLLR